MWVYERGQEHRVKEETITNKYLQDLMPEDNKANLANEAIYYIPDILLPFIQTIPCDPNITNNITDYVSDKTKNNILESISEILVYDHEADESKETVIL